MPNHLLEDAQHLERLLNRTLDEALAFLASVDERSAGAVMPPSFPQTTLADDGIGADTALSVFKERYEPWISGSAGPRYFGFVTGGATPAALMGDWLTSVYDQNALGSAESVAAQLELDTLSLLRDLFGLSDAHAGSFVSGATMANFVGLAIGRQWIGQQHGVDIARDGVHAMPPLRVLSGTPHSSVYKALAMLGIGRNAVVDVACLPDREAVDVNALEDALKAEDGRPCLVVANTGTLNTVDFDDLRAIAMLRDRHPFWLHVDGAFGAFAACSPRYRHLIDGLDLADSITVDAHKWLNVPYDAAMQFSRHPALQAQVFQNAAVYLGQEIGLGNFVHRTPENSRRLRALASWFSLTAYGRQGYAAIVENCCQLAQWLGNQIAAAPEFILLAPVRMNGLCFTFASTDAPVTLDDVQRFLAHVTADGGVFLTPTIYAGIPAIRASISNWRTTAEDLHRAWAAIQRTARKSG
ncbi:aspartate aminotransferase family protein [bacterium]|nr:aspartate aminotransferase family protein [bacterium]